MEPEYQPEEEFIGYRLTLTVAGINYSENIEIESVDLAELYPTYTSAGPETFPTVYERYAGEDEHEFFEIRQDYIISRRIERIKPDPLFDSGTPEADRDDSPDGSTQSEETPI